MVPKHLRKSSESLGGDQESLMASFIELQGRIKNDKSILRQPIDTGVRGVRDLMKAVVGGTEELQDLLLNECTIIYECKICRNLFRSLANFVSHKRIYCINSFTYFTGATAKQEREFFQQSDIALDSELMHCNKGVNPNETKEWHSNNKSVPNNIKNEKNNCLKPSRRIKISPVKIGRKCDIAKIADGLNQKAKKESLKEFEEIDKSNFYSDIAERVMIRRIHQQTSPQQQHLNSSRSNEFNQSSREGGNVNHRNNMPLEVTDRLAPSNEAVLQENGKFRVTPQGMRLENNSNLANFKCSLCETHFITQHALSRHVQIHHKERICYPCPICRIFFPSPGSTYKHLSKDHHKTEQQIRRLRPKVLAKARKRKLVDGNPKSDEKSAPKLQRLITNPEEDLRCPNCGKLFNRHAVLRVHLSSCKEKEPAKQSTTPKPTPAPVEVPNKTDPKMLFPRINDTSNPKPSQQKSGILVRRDYNKKLNNCNTKTLNSLPTKTVRVNHECKGNNLKRVNKWRTVLKKLHSKNGINVNDSPESKNDSKKEVKSSKE